MIFLNTFICADFFFRLLYRLKQQLLIHVQMIIKFNSYLEISVINAISLKGFRYHKLVKRSTKLYHRYIDIIPKYETTRVHLIRLGILYPIFYDNNFYKTQKCRHSFQNLTKPVNRLIYKGNDNDTVVR